MRAADHARVAERVSEIFQTFSRQAYQQEQNERATHWLRKAEEFSAIAQAYREEAERNPE